MQQDSPKQAIRLLRKAVPLMTKLNIAPTPYNYGLWYEYVANRNLKLNKLMDTTIRRLGSLPGFIARELFHEYVADQDYRFGNDHRDKLEQVINDVSRHSDDMSKELSSLNETLARSRKALKRTNGQEQIAKVIRYLERGTSQAAHQSQVFQQSLEDAQAEIRSLKSALEEARHNTETDSLTQLKNQKGLERHLFQWMPDAEDDLSLLLIDIDQLGLINTERGYRHGNQLIRLLASILDNTKPEQSIVSRLDGGTFALLINEATLDFSSQYADQLRANIEKQVIRDKHSKTPIGKMTVSIGVATTLGQETPEALLERAERHLANAKQLGRNCVTTR